MQAAPIDPQCATSGVVQVVPSQQPVPHEARSQTHAPPTQCCPVAHGAPPPHTQWPVASHPSLAIGSHAVQASPLIPHVVALDVLHVVPEQQPLAHVAVQPAHAPFVHAPPPHD